MPKLCVETGGKNLGGDEENLQQMVLEKSRKSVCLRKTLFKLLSAVSQKQGGQYLGTHVTRVAR
jgi:hypothetical protein